MGSCWSCLYRDPIRDNHLTKFKVTNVDDEGNELGSGIMELTQTELILHTRKRDAIRWPYLCLRRYGYDSNLFSFESGRRCQTGQGIFAFKCSRAEEIFNLLQELMQCNSINVVEESMMMSRSGHTPEMEMSRTPQTPNTPAFPVPAFPNGYPGYPIRGDSSQPSLADDRGHSLMGLEDQVRPILTHTYVNTVSMEGDLSMRHCVHSLPEVRPSTFPETTRGEHNDPQVFLQPSSQEVKFMLGPTPAQRHLLERERERERERHGHNPHNLHLWVRAAAAAPGTVTPTPSCTRTPTARRLYPPQGYGCERGMGGGHRRTALLNYENLPSLPPVWEYGDGRGIHRDALQNYVNTEQVQPPRLRHACPPHSRPCQPDRGGRIFSFDFRRRSRSGVEGCEHGHMPPSRQLNYIQVDLEGEPPCQALSSGGAQTQPQHQRLPPKKCGPQAPRRSECYAVIDLKKTAAMSNLQKALPRDDGTSRKTRHNSTDLPL
uniref:Fibroblast growth factor receptor substrate 3 n=1 Tax=Dicentrarchus labrax TaxID=13489 RepID=A0A8P4K7N4_DICLA